MTRGDGGSSAQAPGELRVVGRTVGRGVELVPERVDETVGRRGPRVVQVGSRPLVADRNERNWRSLIAKRFDNRANFVGIDLRDGANVDHVLDICSERRTMTAKLGEEPFDLVICCHVLEHTRRPAKAARNIESALRPGGVAYVSTPWSQAFHATPDDYWRFSVRGLMLMFERLEVLSLLYSGGEVGLDVAYRVVRAGKTERV